MDPLHVDGAYPRGAGTTVSSSPGSTPRPDADSIARSKQAAAAFTAQIEMSMLQSLAQLGSAGEDPASDDGDGGSGGDLGLGSGFDQSQLMATLFTGFQARGASAAQVQAQLSSLGGIGGNALGLGGDFAGAGAGSEALLAQSLLSSVGGASPTTGIDAPAKVSGDAATNARVVAQVARQQGVDPVVAVAMMLVESGGNAAAVGDGGTSFGLFQLHEGGMLTSAGLEPTQAFDARTNATVALRSYAHEWSKGHERRSPGEIAAASQRPADPVGYAKKVDAAMDRARALLGA